MKQRARMWSRLSRSAWDAAAYRESAAGRGGSLFGYLAFLIAIATAVVTIHTHVLVARAVTVAKPLIRAQFPEIRITNGTVSSPVKQPYVWEHGGGVFILDATGATTHLDSKYARGLLLTKTELIYLRNRRNVVEERRYQLSRFRNVVLDVATVERWLELAKSWLWIVVAVPMYGRLWLENLCVVFFWSLLSLIVNAASRRALPYGALVRIGIYALTVPSAITLLKDSLGLADVLKLVSPAVYIGYLVWGILVQPVPAAEPVETRPPQSLPSS